MRKLPSVVVLGLSLGLVLVGGGTAEAQSCGAIGGVGPATFTLAGLSWWYFDFPTAQRPIAHIGQIDGPNTPVYGVDWYCDAYNSRYASIFWDTAVSLTDNEICIFQTSGGLTCQVQGSDGLPVELMDFAVE